METRSVRSRSTSRVTYVLGTIIGGSTYFFTALPEFKTEQKARQYAVINPTGSMTMVFKHSELFYHGINWGSDDQAIGTIDITTP